MDMWWAVGDEGGHVAEPEWADIRARLHEISLRSGIVEVESKSASGQLRSLQVRADNGAYVLTLGEESAEGWLFRILRQASADAGTLDILGDAWNAGLSGHDLDAVVGIFEPFVLTGTAPAEPSTSV